MSQTTKEYTQAVAQSYTLAVDAFTSWVEESKALAQSVTDSFVKDLPAEREMPTPVAVVDTAFDRAEAALKLQRRLAHGLAEAYAPVVDRAIADAQAAVTKVAETTAA